MTEDTKLKLVVGAGILAVTAVGTGITRHVNKRRLKKPLPGTTKIERVYIIKDKTKKK